MFALNNTFQKGTSLLDTQRYFPLWQSVTVKSNNEMGEIQVVLWLGNLSIFTWKKTPNYYRGNNNILSSKNLNVYLKNKNIYQFFLNKTGLSYTV